jgi:hypothetical protein
MALDMSMLRRVDRFLGVGFDRPGDAEIAAFAVKYKIGMSGLLEDNGITYVKFRQFLQRVIMTGDALTSYLSSNPIVLSKPRGYVPGMPAEASVDMRVLIGQKVTDAIGANSLSSNPMFYRDYPDNNDQINAFYGALRSIDQNGSRFNFLALQRIRDFRNDAVTLRNTLSSGENQDAVYTDVRSGNF